MLRSDVLGLPEKERLELAANPMLPPHVFDILLDEPCGAVAVALAANPSIGWQMHDAFAEHPNLDVRIAAASNTGGHLLSRRLVKHDRWQVRTAYAANPTTQFDDLWSLSRDDSPSVRAAVAANPNTHPDELRTMSSDDEWAVRHAVRHHPSTPSDVRDALRVEFA
jgi:hypothetical protein